MRGVFIHKRVLRNGMSGKKRNGRCQGEKIPPCSCVNRLLAQLLFQKCTSERDHDKEKQLGQLYNDLVSHGSSACAFSFLDLHKVCLYDCIPPGYYTITKARPSGYIEKKHNHYFPFFFLPILLASAVFKGNQ